MGPARCTACKRQLTTSDGRCYSVRCRGRIAWGISDNKPYTKKKLTRSMIKARRKKGRR